jgi:anhydro-N-acetylmuramic acid kinase
LYKYNACMNFIDDKTIYAGIMTGTSLDGLDAVLADFSVPNRPRVLAHISVDYPPDLRDEMLALQAGSDGAGINELHRSRVAGIQLAQLHIQALHQLFDSAAVNSPSIAAIGVHGQTVRHVPTGMQGDGRAAYTVQLLESSRIAEALRCTVVSDFRARDIAAGGQGAPLVPAFHAALCVNQSQPTAFVNIGGFANVSLLNKSHIQGFDTGPGNVLMDAWISQHLNQPYDKHGQWAASGRVHQALLSHLYAQPYFVQTPPKSTGRELFNLTWLHAALHSNKFVPFNIPAVDVQATLCELTALSIADAVKAYLPTCESAWVCGGGAYNQHLMQRLSSHLPCRVATTAAIGIEPQQMEALAFAWLARQCILGLPSNVPMVTGATGLRVLGQICPA